MVDLIARKPLTYRTRRLLPGDLFHAGPRDARILKAIRKAADAPSAEVDTGEASPLLDTPALRAEYKRVLGKQPFAGWDDDTLRGKISAHLKSEA